jgi:hypothetical protein
MTKLPSGRLARHAYLELIGNWRGLVQIGGLWLLLGWALALLARGGAFLFTAAADLVVTLGAAAVAVAWHRHLLLGEPFARRLAPLDARVARYLFLTVILAFLIGTAPAVVLLMVGGSALLGGAEAGADPDGAGLGLLLVPIVAIACLWVALRVQLIFPATAIADQAMTPARSWALTRGQGGRLFLGFVLVTLPVTVAMVALTLILSWLADATGSIVLSTLSELAAVANPLLQAPLIAAFLSYAYTWFRQQEGQGVAVAARPPA